MPMLDIPYAQSAPYDNSGYVARMADLMLRRGDVEADALRRAGDRRAQMWTNAGNVAMSTIAQIGAARDAERQRALALQQQAFENEMKQREYALREREADEAAKARQQQQEWQQQQYRDRMADVDADNVAPGTSVPYESAKARFGGTPAWYRGEVIAPQPAAPAWQGDQPLDDSMPDAGPATPAVPGMWRRMPNGQEKATMDAAAAAERERIYQHGQDTINQGALLEERRRQQANEDRRYREGVRQFEETQSGAAGERLSEEGLDYAATQLRVTGKMPAMGMGKDPDRKRIINAAAAQAKRLGQTPAAVMQRQATFKADGQALTRMATARAAAAAFEEKALQQADLVANLSQQVSRTDWPIINGAFVKGQVLTGGTNAHLLNNALLTFTTEYAKIMSGSTGSAQGSTDAARREAQELISSALSKGTLAATIAQMKREMTWTVEGYNAAIGRIQDGLAGGNPTWEVGEVGPRDPSQPKPQGSDWFDNNAPGKKP